MEIYSKKYNDAANTEFTRVLSSLSLSTNVRNTVVATPLPRNTLISITAVDVYTSHTCKLLKKVIRYKFQKV